MNEPSDKRFCCTLCLCQMVAILSAVSMVYLAVAIYAPSFRALESDMKEVPVMCYTIGTTTLNMCNVTPTCGEWCLSKSQGNCTVVTVMARNNGSNLRLEECTDVYEKECQILKLNDDDMVNCVKDECKELSGQYNCTKGKCHDYTTLLQCKHQDLPEWPIHNCNKHPRNCRGIQGLFQCKHGNCKEIHMPYTCERRCVDIQTMDKNVVILQGDVFLLARCKRVVLADTGREIWNDTKNTLMASCFRAETQENRTLVVAEDCINGTLLPPDAFTGNSTNLTMMMQTYWASQIHLNITKEGGGPEDEVEYPVPLESDLVIYNSTQLRINIEGCVNTLRNECEGVMEHYGRDGSTHSAPARFPCYYSSMDSSFVVLNFSRQAVVMELMIASILPISLFVVSCFTLAVCSKTVIITDEGHFKCKYCGNDDLDGGLDSSGERAMAL